MRASSVILIIMLALFFELIAPSGSAAVKLDEQYNKNGEVYVLLRETTAGGDFARQGIYKTCEYQVDDTGQRTVLVAKPANVANVCVTRGQDFNVGNYGIAVNKDRVCYTFTNEVSDVWKVGGPEWRAKKAASWLVGSQCTHSHFHAGHGRGTFSGQPGWFKASVGSKLDVSGTIDAKGDFTGVSGTTVVWPCSIRDRGWRGGPWPDPIGPFTTQTVEGVAVRKANSNMYMVPMGMSYHDWSDSRRNWSMPYVFMVMGSLKPTNLRMHNWRPLGGFSPWTKDLQTMPPYEDVKLPDVVFQLFEAKYRVFITTPCGDACRSGSAGGSSPAGKSTISVTITPFGRAYGLQVVKTDDTEMTSIKRYDPGVAGGPIEYTPLNWTSKSPKLHLKTIRTRPGSNLSATNWGDARKIATSYKFSATEVVGDTATKQEFVYLSDSDFFCVADTWFGDGGRAFFGKNIEEGGKKGVLFTSQTRDEVKSATEEKHFKVFRRVQDIAADGYGNLFVLCTTGLQEIEKTMDANSSDFTKLRTALTAPDEWGYTVVDPASYEDDGWFVVDGRRFRDIKFNLIVYKTILKINSNHIDEKGSKNESGAKDMLSLVAPTPVGQLKVGLVPCERRCELSGAKVIWGPLSSPLIADFPAELAAINIAAPPEEQGVNYYIDIKGPTNNTAAGGEKDRATRATDTVYEGEAGTWSMENGPEFDAIYGLNINNGTSLDDDENRNGTVGSLRNNIVKQSLVAKWKVYRLYDIEKLALPEPPVENETLAQQAAAGKYQENLLFEKTLIFAGTNDYPRKKGGTNQTVYGGAPGFAAVADPFTLSHTFKEAGIYKVCLSVDFDYYEYWKLEFGSNRSARDSVKQSSDDLSVPSFFKSKPGFPVFNHRNDTRFVVVLSRDAQADDDHIRKIYVSAMKSGSETPLPAIEAPEVDRSRDVKRAEIASLYRDKVDDRLTPLTEEEVDRQRMTEHDVVGDFVIRFASALPGIGDTSNAPSEREAIEKFGGCGVYDYVPDEIWNYNGPSGRNEVGGGPLKAAAGVNALHPPNWKSGTNESDATTFQVYKYSDATKDRLALVKRNYGLSGHGTLVRSLSQNKLDAMQAGMNAADKFYQRRYPVPDSQWNGYNGSDYPIREIDWDNVRYQWTIDYKVDGKPVHEEPASYGGTVGELLRARWDETGGFDAHAFIARLGTRNYPDPTVSANGKNVFREDASKPAVDIDAQKVPAFHVRIPMLEFDQKTRKYKPIRWETPIAPEIYRVGLRVWSPSLKWQQDKSFKITAEKKNDAGAVEATFKDKQVYWDLVDDRVNVARCDPALDPTKGLRVWVIDREPPRFRRTGADRVTAAHFSFKGATTGDKYTGREVLFNIVENNPNISTAVKQYAFGTKIGGGKFNPDDGMSIEFPLQDSMKGGSAHETERYMFRMKDGDYAMRDNAPGRCFDFEIDPTKEMCGAPYAEGGFILPVCADGRSGAQVTRDDLVSCANDAAGNNGTLDPGNKNKDAVPFMPPDYIGNLPYGILFQIPAKVLADLKAAPEAGIFTVPDEFKPGMFFEVADNDPPQVFVNITTSFTEVADFGFAALDDTASKFKYDYATRQFDLATYRSRLNGNDPSAWPAALVDALYGPGNLFDYGDSYITWKGEKEEAAKLVAGVADDRTVEVKAVRVFIPEKSRAIFEIRAIDNVPRGGDYVVDLGADNFAWEMQASATGAANERFEKEVTTAENVSDARVMNLYGIFRLPANTAAEGNVLKLRVADDKIGGTGSNLSEVHVHVHVVNTFLKQEKLDMENTRIDIR